MSPPRRAAGFIVSGAIAFATDAAVLAVLTRGFGFDPFLARIAAISAAMIAGYFAHRRLTFNVAEKPTIAEFGAFAGVASGAALLNYAVYAGLLIAFRGLDPLAALAASSIVAMAASYAGYRFGVFRPRN